MPGPALAYSSELTYAGELTRAMALLARDPRVVFLGQAVRDKGTAMTATFADVPRETLLEMPVAEDLQMGISIGLALAGFIPVSVYPRWNFLLLATNQLVNHLDKLPLMGQPAKVIVRVGVGSQRPMHPWHQHVGNYAGAFEAMLKTVKVVELIEPWDIFPAYERALASSHSTILVEWGDAYHEK